MSAAGCDEFRPHHLWPDKCGNCFADLTRHSSTKQQPQEPAGSSANNQPTKELVGADSSSNSTNNQCASCRAKQETIDKLVQELGQWQARCQTAEQESEQARDELRSLEREMEEMHDNFKEEESEQFEQVKQELDAAIKNCKILQIRLNKSERQYAQLEQVKSMLECQLEERKLNESSSSSNFNQPQISGNQQEQTKFVQLGTDSVKLSTREYDQLLRDLNDTIERERDLQEQIKYSQEEAQLKGERLQAVELENEVLLGRINKLTLANSRLRSSLPLQLQSNDTDKQTDDEDNKQHKLELRDLFEQNEQLKLALEVSQSECNRLRSRLQEMANMLESKENAIRELEARCRNVSESLSKRQKDDQLAQGQTGGRIELECRQLRARLVHSERECRQLKAQLELFVSSGSASGGGGGGAGPGSSNRRVNLNNLRSQSVESATNKNSITNCNSNECHEKFKHLQNQYDSLATRNNDLERKLQRFTSLEMEQHDLGMGQTQMESDLLGKLKRQLDMSENELAKARSRLVELDLECGRTQRQYKRLLSSLEARGSGDTQLTRKSKLPAEPLRDGMSRQELRQAIRDLESDLDEMLSIIRAKDCLIEEMQCNSSKDKAEQHQQQSSGQGDLPDCNKTSEEQLKSLRRLIDQERLLSNNLKLDVANLERDKFELETIKRMMERQRVAMAEELDKLRQLNGELRNELEESQRDKSFAIIKSKELNESLDKVRSELAQARNELSLAQEKRQTSSSGGGGESLPPTRNQGSSSPASGPSDLMLMARDLSELKVKNGFLMRQLEMTREDTTRQLEELKESCEAQQRRAVELAQLELKERQLAETQQLRDEVGDLKQRLAVAQRQATRQEEETTLERDRARAIERDWRRDKSQWQQQKEQLEGQLAIERRSSEFKYKEAEAVMREKERALINMQDRCVQLERDLKRLQNKYRLLEEDSESRIKTVTRELELRSKELSELSADNRQRESNYYETCRRLTDEKSTLGATLETIRKSYDEKLLELKQLKELLKSRQEHAYKERMRHIEQIELLANKLNESNENDTQVKLVKQRFEMQERQLESARRDMVQLREERNKLKSRCDELEKCELIARTSTISGSMGSGTFMKSPLGGRLSHQQSCSESREHQQKMPSAGQSSIDPTEQTIERLSGKINDQRHLINMLRQQLSETQLELKQLKLIQASERSKAQTRVAILTSRLNEFEEKLAFETLLLAQNSSLVNSLVRPAIESNWAKERQATNELIQQQQAQIELLTKDLKKVSQAHDMLRLHTKQLQMQNNKLSKRLIEYQQQQQPAGVLTQQIRENNRELEARYERLSRRNVKLSQEIRPIVAIVAKIVASLDAPDQQAVQKQITSPSDSTNRPLRAPTSGSSATNRRKSDESDTSLAPDVISTAPPAHQLAADKHHQPSRLARMLAGKSSPTKLANRDNSNGSAADQKPKKAVKRVRIKCSSLGITTTEKKQLKMHLKSLSEALEAAPEHSDAPMRGRVQSPSAAPDRRQQVRASSETGTDSGPSSMPMNARTAHLSNARASADPVPHSQRSINNSNHDETDQSSSHQSHTGRVHWQLDSDLDSERSWSAEPATGRQRAAADAYRRFPQATPSTGYPNTTIGVSLTDCDSESSLTSEYSLSTFPTRRRATQAGAESDSGLAAAGAANRKRSKGFKSRLTNTLRNISRSITGLGSDSEAGSESAFGGSSTGSRQSSRKGARVVDRGEHRQAQDGQAANLKEIRV